MKPALFLPALALLAAGCSRPATPPRDTPAAPPARVRVAAVQAADLPVLTEVPGTVRPARRAVLAAQVAGEIVALPVVLGQAVRAGETVVRLAAADAEARVVQARAQLNLVRRDLARERELLAKGASTAETVRILGDRSTGLEAGLREAEVRLGHAEIRAPFAGVVARRPAQAGDLALPGQPLLEVEGAADFALELDVPETLAAGLRTGATLAAEAGGVRFAAAVTEIASAADPATRTVRVKAAVPATAAVRSGHFGRATVAGPARRTLLAPAAALTPLGQMERVFVAGGDGRAVLRLVRTGAASGDRVEILAGLEAGERVVLAPPATLREGQPLEVQP